LTRGCGRGDPMPSQTGSRPAGCDLDGEPASDDMAAGADDIERLSRPVYTARDTAAVLVFPECRGSQSVEYYPIGVVGRGQTGRIGNHWSAPSGLQVEIHVDIFDCLNI